MSDAAPFPRFEPAAGFLPVLRDRPDIYDPLRAAADAVMKAPAAPGGLSPGQRELVAVYASGLGGCAYCRDSHVPIAELLGMKDAAAAVKDPDAKTRALFNLADAVCGTGPVRRERVEAVTAAGWGEAAAEDVVRVAALFGFFNRVVRGYGLTGTPAKYAAEAPFLANSYQRA